MKPAAVGATPRFSLEPSADKAASAHALEFAGYLNAPRDGVYVFTVRSNDGSRLHVGSVQVVDNDGLHKERAISGFVALRKGQYPIKLEYFDAGGAAALSAHYAGPGIPYQEIPPQALSRQVR